MAKVQSGVICGHVSTNASIPAGWSRVTALDARFVKQIATSATNPGATGGAASHAHTSPAHGHSYPSHAHSFGNTGSNDGIGDYATGNLLRCAELPVLHSHSTVDGGTSFSTVSDGPTTWSTETTDPPHLVVIFIKSDGTPTGLPVNALAYFNGESPAGWTIADGLGGRPAAVNRLLKGAAVGGDGGATAGAGDVHTHSMAVHDHGNPASHSQTLSFGTTDVGNIQIHEAALANVVPCAGHAHAAATSGSATNPARSGTQGATGSSNDVTPPWKKMLPIVNTSGSVSLPLNIICVWEDALASIPVGWQLCDGSAPPAPATTTPNLSEGKYVRGAASLAEVGTIGGSATHPHTGGSHTHTSGDAGHTHTSAATGAATPLTTSSVDPLAGNAMRDTHTHAAGATSGSASIPATNSTTPTTDANTSNDPVFTAVAYIQLISLPPLAPTIETPVIGATYSGILTLAATTTDPESHNWRSEWEYSADGGTIWASVPGDGTPVASGAQSRLDWDTATVSPGINYKVRLWGIDSVGVEGDKTTLGGTFIIGPSLSAIHAESDVAFFVAENDTAAYFAENDTARFVAEKD